MADTKPSPGTSGKAPSEAPPTTAVVVLGGPDSVKSSHTATYTVKLNVANGTLKDAALTLGGSWHGGTVKWTGGCVSVDGATCNAGDVKGAKELTATYSAPKVSKNTSATLTVSAKGKANDGELSAPAKSQTVVVKKPTTSSPTPTKTAKPTPTKTSHKPTPTKSHQGHSPSHKPSHKPSHAPSPAPTGHGNVPYPTGLPSWPSSQPSIPNGTQSPWNPGTPTNMPTLPSVAPSPEGSPRNPNVAEPQHKASGQVHTDAVSVPAAAAAAFVGIGAGTLITRSVRRRGLWRPIGRHRD